MARVEAAAVRVTEERMTGPELTSLTCGMNPSIKRAIATIPEGARQRIRYPRAIVDPHTGELMSDAEVAEIPAYTQCRCFKR
ncbi:hypothetical protein [Streptomyces sp. YGL11-2]|uniref:hypothetical protein n=1 Tax=Streptomyces sp. YGL11-2 TaxID=3414028 RepID=UPI003CE67B12